MKGSVGQTNFCCHFPVFWKGSVCPIVQLQAQATATVFSVQLQLRRYVLTNESLQFINFKIYIYCYLNPRKSKERQSFFNFNSKLFGWFCKAAQQWNDGAQNVVKIL
jgi:hypothetical protein